MKFLVVNNLASGYGEGAIYDLIRALDKDGNEICLRSTNGATDLVSLLHDANRFDAVIASGGDGTIAAAAYALAGTGIPLFPFPAGTANLLCLNLCLPNEPHAMAKLFENMKTMDFDVVELKAPGITRGFNIMAGAGYDAKIMKDAQSTKKFLGPLSYFTAAVTNITPQTSHFVLNLDGKIVESDGLGILLINFPKIQFDVPVVHGSNPRDGIIEIAILKSSNAIGLLPAIGAAILDRDGGFPDRSSAVEIHQAHSVSFTADPPLHVEFDGEAVENTTPVTATVLHRAVRFIVADETLKAFA